MSGFQVDTRMRGLIIGTGNGVENSLMAHLTLRGFDIHQAADYGSVVGLLESTDYNFILFLDRTEDDLGPQLLQSLTELAPDSKIIVLVQGARMGIYTRDIPKTVCGFFHLNSNISFLETVIQQLFIKI